jgi:glycosyltransferase involved in cell wall biosynthesis
MKASVVIPTSNRDVYLDRTLRKLCRQSIHPKKYEIVIVDDGSIDSTESVVNKYRIHSDFLVRYKKIDKTSPGNLSMVRNIGIKISTGDICIFLDSDVLVGERYIEEHLRLHTYRSGLLVMAAVHYIPKEMMLGNFIENPHVDDIPQRYLNYREILQDMWSENMSQIPDAWSWGAGGNCSAPRSCIEAVGGYDTDIYGWGPEDQDFCYRLCRDSSCIPVWNRRAAGFHQYHGGEFSERKLAERKRNLRYLADKYEGDIDFQRVVRWNMQMADHVEFTLTGGKKGKAIVGLGDRIQRQYEFLNDGLRRIGINANPRLSVVVFVTDDNCLQLDNIVRSVNELDIRERMELIVVDTSCEGNTDVMVQTWRDLSFSLRLFSRKGATPDIVPKLLARGKFVKVFRRPSESIIDMVRAARK